MIKSFKRWRSKFTHYRDWRVIYPNGTRSIWVNYVEAFSLKENFGGELEWIGDQPKKQEWK